MGDFNHVTYILSFDKDVVTQALGQTYSSQKSSTFLEKIIQLQIEVPLINKKILIKEWKNSLDRVLNSNSINFDDKEWFELQESLEKGFLHNLDDLRKIKNIENSLSYVLPILKDKVYVVDLIVIESMRFFYPNLYSSLKYKKIDIFDERKDFDERVALYNNSNAQDERNKRIIKEFYEITRIKEISNYHGILSVIKKLFPTIKRFFTGSNYGFETQEFKAKLRVGSVDFFERYFSYNLNPREIPESLIKELLFELKDNSEFNIKINELLSQYEHYEIINKIFIYMDFVEDKTMVIVSLLACYNLFDNQYYNNDFFPIRNRERFLRNIVNFIESHNILQDLMVDKIILEKMDDELFVDFSILILGHNMINMETKKYLSQSLISRMEDNFNILDYPKSFEISSLIHLLKQSESFDVENYLNKVIKSERDIVIFLTSFCSFINSERVIKFDVEIIKNIHQAYCSDALTKKIEEICPKYLDAKESELKESVIGKYLITRNAT